MIIPNNKRARTRVIARDFYVPSPIYRPVSEVSAPSPALVPTASELALKTSSELREYESVEAPSVIIDKEISVIQEQRKFRFYAEVIGYVVQISVAILFFVVLMMSLRGRGPPNGLNNFISNKTYEKESIDVKFADVAGLDVAKEELQEIVDFLKNPEKYVKIGAKIPRGCLLTGGPGLGKTLLAKAVAGEAGVPFFSCSASEFIELFVGVGASRIRDMFKKAKEKAPCIIFIDEIDAIGRARAGNNGLSNNDEREQTINQLLTEMDGFDTRMGIVVIAATNRADILDPALVRPGRFDRQIMLELPGLNAREAILKVHGQNKPFEDDVSFHDIAKITVGFSGAELANLLNESAILAARKGKEIVGKIDIEQALERILLGLEKKDLIISPEKRRLTAYHEAGHALVALKIGDFDTIKKVSIMPRGKTGGVTMFEQDPEKMDSGMYSRKYLENQLAVALGGRVAEELVVGSIDTTTGAASDLERVQQIARSMIMRFGFSDKLGPVSWKDGSKFETSYSERTLYEIDSEVRKLATTAYNRAKNILMNNKELLKDIAELLMEREIINGDDIKMLEGKQKRMIRVIT